MLLSMGISSASELAEIFLSSDRMDFDGFCIMIAPETARKCREKARSCASTTITYQAQGASAEAHW